jgi:ribonuclease P/MRP protein subunit RPP40
MESMIKEKLSLFLDENRVLSSTQHGFTTGRSCLTNLLESLEMWTKALDDGYGLDIVYLDYRKAFDSVPHKRLIEKLKTCGISGNLLRWIENFLTSRTMRVGIRGTFSQLINVLSGVPQGSVLGPVLFLLFVNDLPTWIKDSIIKMFADDTKLWNRIGMESDSSTLQANINRLGDWSQKWLLTFNPAKCKVMHVGHALQTKYYMNDGSTTTELAPVTAEKDLGVNFTRDLKSSTQCRNSAAKARRIIGMVHRHFRRLGKQDFLLIYKSYIRPHLEYSIQAWSPHLRKDIDTLETVQKAATNLVPELRRYDYETRLEKLGITTLEKRR